MKNEIEKLLNDVETEKSKARQKAKGFYNMKSNENGMWNDGSVSAFDFVIERLKKILNERNSVDEGEIKTAICTKCHCEYRVDLCENCVLKEPPF